jgi:hypothetical protein
VGNQFACRKDWSTERLLLEHIFWFVFTELYGDAGLRSLLQQVAQNPQLMTNMLQAPYVQSMLQAMSTNPQLVEQVCSSVCNNEEFFFYLIFFTSCFIMHITV